MEGAILRDASIENLSDFGVDEEIDDHEYDSDD